MGGAMEASTNDRQTSASRLAPGLLITGQPSDFSFHVSAFQPMPLRPVVLQAIETVHSGASFFSPDVAHLVLSRLIRGNGPGLEKANLTNREREVLTCIAQGLSNKEIACRLNIGTRTVETHRERLMRKLEIYSVAGLTRFAVAKGLIPLPEMATA